MPFSKAAADTAIDGGGRRRTETPETAKKRDTDSRAVRQAKDEEAPECRVTSSVQNLVSQVDAMWTSVRLPDEGMHTGRRTASIFMLVRSAPRYKSRTP